MARPPHPPPPNRLSRTVPKYAVRLAHEPSVGLHFLAAHAQTRAAPALAAASRAADKQSGKIAEGVLDVRDATKVLSEEAPGVCAALSRMHKLIAESTERVKNSK